MFRRYNETGDLIRNRVQTSFEGEEILTEQSHKDAVDVNNIVKKHGLDMLQKTAQLQSLEFQMDELPTNDFTEALAIVTKASQTFESMPSFIRKKFDNSPAQFLDFVQNPANGQAMVDMGLAERVAPTPPMQVQVINPAPTEPETPIE